MCSSAVTAAASVSSGVSSAAVIPAVMTPGWPVDALITVMTAPADANGAAGISPGIDRRIGCIRVINAVIIPNMNGPAGASVQVRCHPSFQAMKPGRIISAGIFSAMRSAAAVPVIAAESNAQGLVVIIIIGEISVTVMVDGVRFRLRRSWIYPDCIREGLGGVTR